MFPSISPLQMTRVASLSVAEPDMLSPWDPVSGAGAGGLRSPHAAGGAPHSRAVTAGSAHELRAGLQEEMRSLLSAPPEVEFTAPHNVVLLVGVNGSGTKAKGRSMEEMHPELEPTTAAKPRWSWDDGGVRPPTATSSRTRAPDAADMDDDDEFATMRL